MLLRSRRDPEQLELLRRKRAHVQYAAAMNFAGQRLLTAGRGDDEVIACDVLAAIIVRDFMIKVKPQSIFDLAGDMKHRDRR